MRNRLVNKGSWVHVFAEGTFAGRVRRLIPGQQEVIRKIGSIIVGPSATAKVVNIHGRDVLSLPPRKIISDFAKFLPKLNASHIRVMEA